MNTLFLSLPVLGLLTAIVIAGMLCYTLLRIIDGAGGRNPTTLSKDETRMMQEIYQGLSKMEARIEVLESLLLERNRNGDTKS
ncbi:MAG: hypothetical protein ACLFTT_12680 [Candidatus Hydrogenedentota bacterium]